MLGRTLLWLSDSPRMERFVRQGRLSRPVVRRFVAGDLLEDALRAIEELNREGIGGILDLLGEGVDEASGAAAAAQEYDESIDRIRDSGIDSTVSIKLSQLGLTFDPATCLEHVRRLVLDAKEAGTTLEIDMEDSPLVDGTLEVFRTLRGEFENVRLAVQSYLRRAYDDLDAMADLKPKVRLVKGAYSEPPELAFQTRQEIDAEFRRMTEWLFAKGTDPALGTHDHLLIDHAKRLAEQNGAGRKGFEIQMLYGVRTDLQRALAREGYRVRVYVPFGKAWYPYLMRRMAERPANLKFFLRALVGR